jgi:hypothetical protein
VGSAWGRNGFSSSGWFAGFAGSVALYMQDSVLAEFEPDIRRIGLRIGRRCLAALPGR